MLLGLCRRFASSASGGLGGSADVLIVGGGLVGNATAAAIAANPALADLSVRVLEAGPAPRKGPAGSEKAWSNRVSSISPASRRLFQRLGIWEGGLEAKAQPVRRMMVWDACSQARICYKEGREPIAWLLQNAHIVSALLERLTAAPNVAHTYEAQIASLRIGHSPGEPGTIGLESGEEWACDLLVGADGARSAVRSSLNIPVHGWEYGQKGIVATLRLASQGDPENQTAWQRFTPTGPIALLPLAPGVSSLVWSAKDSVAEELLSLDEAAFVERLNAALLEESEQSGLANSALFGLARLGHFLRPGWTESTDEASVPLVESIEPGSRASFPLGLSLPSGYIGPGAVLVGDAAHRIHPLAGLGLNLGLGDAAELVHQLGRGVENGARVGDSLYLQDYQRRRLAANLPVAVATETLHRLYSTTFPPIVALRSVGLAALDACVPAKNLIIAQASK